MSRAALAAVAVAAVGLGGCGVAVDGDFSGVPWTPDATILVVADRLELLDRGGAVVPVKKSDAAQTLDVLLTAARLEVAQDWRAEPADTLLEWKRDLATSDGLLLRDIPLARFAKGDALEAVREDGRTSGDFDMAVATALPPEETVKSQGLGGKLRVTLEPTSLDAGPHGGSASMKISVARLREAGQVGDVAVGTVNLSFQSALTPERLGESNLTVAAPVLVCAQERGPARAGACRDAAPEQSIDETGVVLP